jgi:hypothetical protein
MAHAELIHGIRDVRVRGVKFDEAAVGRLGIDVLLVFEVGTPMPSSAWRATGFRGYSSRTRVKLAIAFL